jgi:hypothetical protein
VNTGSFVVLSFVSSGISAQACNAKVSAMLGLLKSINGLQSDNQAALEQVNGKGLNTL